MAGDVCSVDGMFFVDRDHLSAVFFCRHPFFGVWAKTPLRRAQQWLGSHIGHAISVPRHNGSFEFLFSVGRQSVMMAA